MNFFKQVIQGFYNENPGSIPDQKTQEDLYNWVIETQAKAENNTIHKQIQDELSKTTGVTIKY